MSSSGTASPVTTVEMQNSAPSANRSSSNDNDEPSSRWASSRNSTGTSATSGAVRNALARGVQHPGPDDGFAGGAAVIAERDERPRGK